MWYFFLYCGQLAQLEVTTSSFDTSFFFWIFFFTLSSIWPFFFFFFSGRGIHWQFKNPSDLHRESQITVKVNCQLVATLRGVWNKYSSGELRHEVEKNRNRHFTVTSFIHFNSQRRSHLPLHSVSSALNLPIWQHFVFPTLSVVSVVLFLFFPSLSECVCYSSSHAASLHLSLLSFSHSVQVEATCPPSRRRSIRLAAAGVPADSAAPQQRPRRLCKPPSRRQENEGASADGRLLLRQQHTACARAKGGREILWGKCHHEAL